MWILFVMAALSRPLFDGNAFASDLGCGDSALHICYESAHQYLIFLAGDPPQVRDMDIHSGGYFVGWLKHRTILTSEGHPTNEKDGPFQLFPFGVQSAFTCPFGGDGWASADDAYDAAKYRYWPRETRVFSVSNTDGPCTLVSENVYSLACSMYGLATNQLFLGRIGTNIFYWETQNPRKVYYRGVVETKTAAYFKLPKCVLDIYGVTKPLRSNKDVGIWAMRRLSRWGHWIIIGAPFEENVFEYSFGQSTHFKGGQ